MTDVDLAREMKESDLKLARSEIFNQFKFSRVCLPASNQEQFGTFDAQIRISTPVSIVFSVPFAFFRFGFLSITESASVSQCLAEFLA